MIQRNTSVCEVVLNKIQQEINELKFPSEVMEFHVNQNILKLVINDRLNDLIDELEAMKLLKESDVLIKKDSNTNIAKETVVNTSLNQLTPHDNDDNDKNEPLDRQKAELEYKHAVILCFWLALHAEKLTIVRELSKLDPTINRI